MSEGKGEKEGEGRFLVQFLRHLQCRWGEGEGEGERRRARSGLGVCGSNSIALRCLPWHFMISRCEINLKDDARCIVH
ncbi:hypothetical protein I3842_13G153400 [Carya illinoinensis]|uniref:Uncharacterized protein n=1 Tax=Carya illinoinensis TaxID=32201 RepID=A0A922DE05_CARIL|nr:hypothetical protein I3842_13G153400 [Carya illinoinensis]